MSESIPLIINIEDKIDRLTLYSLTAFLMSLRSSCKRGRNGAIITQNHRIVSTGYNGSILPNHSCELNCDIKVKCKHAVHAEANAIAAAAKAGIELSGATIYITSSPCLDCAKLIIQAGIKVVVYNKTYETDNGDGLELLKLNNIEFYQHQVKCQ